MCIKIYFIVVKLSNIIPLDQVMSPMGVTPSTNGAFPLHGTVRFGTARYGTVRLNSGRLHFHRSLVPL